MLYSHAKLFHGFRDCRVVQADPYAKTSCETSGNDILDHFAEVGKMEATDK